MKQKQKSVAYFERVYVRVCVFVSKRFVIFAFFLNLLNCLIFVSEF